jgi:hypothetical protein
MKKLMLVCLCLFMSCLNVDAASTAYLALAAQQKSSTQEPKQLSRFKIFKVEGKVYFADEKTGAVCFDPRMSTPGWYCTSKGSLK